MTRFSKCILKKYIVFLIFLLGTIFVTSCGRQEVTSANEETSTVASVNEDVMDSNSTSSLAETMFIDIDFQGGTGKACIKSPVEVTNDSGNLTARFVWSSKKYDYMIVNGVRYENENNGGESTFTVDIDSITGTLTVIGDTTAMSTPHEIEYRITWGEVRDAKKTTDEAKADSDSTEIGISEENNIDDYRKVTVVGNGYNSEGIKKVKQILENSGLAYTGNTKLAYATGFTIDNYGDYALVSIANSGEYLVVPEGKEAPAGLPDDLVILQKPLDKTYLVSTAAMDLINTCGALDMVKLSGTRESDWYIDDAKRAMESGNLVYAGKYRAPDYELILGSGCNLAIENTMIYHEPAVKEKLNELGIPVLVETSSYEQHPLGRLEWIKLYGLLFDHEKEADEYFEKQLEIIEPIMNDNTNTGKTVAFFHVTAGGLINVRKSGDYITKMIELSGGNYCLTGAGEGENALSTMNMQMEEFYAEACEADIIIYNSTIGGEISSINELIRKNELFKDFKAVKEGNVYCTDRNLFQQITGMGEFMKDLNAVFTDTDRNYTYLNKLD
ncbi:ABC transporter substrate-binding protein [Butyrivibrio sp. VCB2006]|uniref:ABC transporter substrate-binding protein n=1 Tax=Butyrivibrio sp. VCB2006 TaxID=1280679 RepID=UPI0004056829|nr:ABC transporter substrate-binding protein [Butyrivibrio sp. VCB2006]